jgi:hypothetical protein
MCGNSQNRSAHRREDSRVPRWALGGDGKEVSQRCKRMVWAAGGVAGSRRGESGDRDATPIRHAARATRSKVDAARTRHWRRAPRAIARTAVQPLSTARDRTWQYGNLPTVGTMAKQRAFTVSGNRRNHPSLRGAQRRSNPLRDAAKERSSGRRLLRRCAPRNDRVGWGWLDVSTYGGNAPEHLHPDWNTSFSSSPRKRGPRRLGSPLPRG